MRIVVNLGDKTSAPSALKRSRPFAEAIKAVLDACVKVNQQYLATYDLPTIYECGVKYQPEPDNGEEEFATIPVVLARGWGDCDDLAPWRVAELRAAGEPAKIRIKWKKNPRTGSKMFHVIVRRADGSVEDPSRRLGMK